MVKCAKRKYKDSTVDTVLRAISLKQWKKDFVMSKQICLECKAWHIVRERRTAK